MLQTSKKAFRHAGRLFETARLRQTKSSLSLMSQFCGRLYWTADFFYVQYTPPTRLSSTVASRRRCVFGFSLYQRETVVSYVLQLVYHDLSGRWSFGVYVGDRQQVKCMNTEQIDAGRHRQASSSHGVYQQCYTSTVVKLSRYDTISIRCLYGSRSVVMQPEFTFWGLIQLARSAHSLSDWQPQWH